MSVMPSRTANVLLAIISSLLTVVVIEIGMQVIIGSGHLPAAFKRLESLHPVFEKNSGSGLYYSHPYISYDMRPGYRNDFVQINDLGFRGDPLQVPKPAGQVRIFALGESTTYGIFNRQNETWPHYLEEQLKSKYPNLDVKVVNAGLVSATTAENLIRLLLRIMPLDPDMLVIYHGYNDLAPRMFNGFSPDYYHFRRTPVAERYALENFYTVRLLVDSLLPDEVRLENANLLEHTWRMENLPSTDADKVSNFQRTDSAVFERNLDYIIGAAIARGLQVAIATFAFDETKENWNSLMPDQIWGVGIEQNNRSVRALATKYGLPLCQFAERSRGDHAVFDDSIHLTSHGNAALAKCFAAALDAAGGMKVSSDAAEHQKN